MESTSAIVERRRPVKRWTRRVRIETTIPVVGKTATNYTTGPRIRQDYPLNLSILISGGKETNWDAPSNGE